MSLVLTILLGAILLCPIFVQWGGKKTRWAISLTLLVFGLFVSFFLFGVEGRIAVKSSPLTGDELNTFAQGVSALASRIWVERVIVGAVIIALFVLAVLDPKKSDPSAG